MNKQKIDKDILKRSAVSILNGMCEEYNLMNAKSIKTIWISDEMHWVVSTPAYTPKQVEDKLEEIIKKFIELSKELKDE